jgi:glycosyltransferase involved in cell wall biosynthesis
MPLEALARTTKFAGLRGCFVTRFCRQVAHRFDLVISTYGPLECGDKTIQFIADFSFDADLRRKLNPLPGGWTSWWYRDSILRKGYEKLCQSVAPPLTDQWKRNLTVANSEWTARLMRRVHGVDSRVIYPPVAQDFPEVAYDKRENGFVCIGRITPEKRMHTVIEILEQVRRRGHDVHLHVVGTGGDRNYERLLESLRWQHREWVFLEGQLFGARKRNLLAGHRFGINGRPNEPFGIVVAEMAKAGCIVFVPNSGGQVEIVNHPALTYDTEDDAVGKIEKVLGDAAMQDALRKHLREDAERFSTETFKQAVRSLVAEVLERG